MPSVPGGAIEIPAPPSEPSPPHLTLPSLLLPLAFSLGFVGAVALAVRSPEPLNLFIAVLSFAIAAVTSVPPALSYAIDRGRFRSASRGRLTTYQAVLAHARAELTRRRQYELDAACQIDPDLAECVARVERRDRHLWSRSPDDLDFLSVRIGTGPRSSSTTVRLSQPDGARGNDPLSHEARALESEVAASLQGPVLLPLGQAGTVALVGDRPAVVESARALAIQIATHHAPDDVKIVALFPVAEAAEWAWLRWLPHVWAEDRSLRYLANDPEGANALAASLSSLLGRRERNGLTDLDRPARLRPTFVCFVAASDLRDATAAIERLSQTNPTANIATIWVGEARSPCAITAEIRHGRCQLVASDPRTPPAPFEPDHIAVNLAERLARSMAPLRPEQRNEPDHPGQMFPDSVDLRRLLDANWLDRIDVAGWWRANDPNTRIEAPLGLNLDGDTVAIALQWQMASTTGGHVIIGGGSGTGKTQVLRTLVGVLAAHYRPHKVCFVLVDPARGQLVRQLDELPHVADRLTEIVLHGDPAGLVYGLLDRIETEIVRRRDLLGGHDLAAFLRAAPRQTERALPQIVVVVDDLDLLLERHPRGDELRTRLTAIARGADGLGVHLVLAAHDPASTVPTLAREAASARIALRMDTAAASHDLLQTDLAHTAVSRGHPGRGYLLRQGASTVESIQFAWADAPYAPGEMAPSASEEVFAVELDGTRHGPRRVTTPLPGRTPSTQLEALVQVVGLTARQAGVGRLRGLGSSGSGRR